MGPSRIRCSILIQSVVGSGWSDATSPTWGVESSCWMVGWCFRTVVLEKTLESPLDSKETKSVNPKGNQLWIFIGRTDAESPIVWPPDVNSQFIGKDPDAGKDWRQEEKGMTEDETVWCHHQLNGREFEQALGDGEAEGSLACCTPWIVKSHTWLNDWTSYIWLI